MISKLKTIVSNFWAEIGNWGFRDALILCIYGDLGFELQRYFEYERDKQVMKPFFDLKKSPKSFVYIRRKPSVGLHRRVSSTWRHSTFRRISGTRRQATYDYGIALCEEEEEDGSDTDFDCDYGGNEVICLGSIGGYELSFESDDYDDSEEDELAFADAEMEQDDNNWEEQDYSGSVSERDDPGEEAAEIEEDGDMMQVVEFGAEELEDDDGDNHVFAGNAVYQYVDMIKLLSSHTSSMIAQGQVDESDDDEAIELTIQEASNESGTEEESEISEAYSEF